MAIKTCDNPKCIHEFQDKRNGKKKRCFNRMADKITYRCTVCGNKRVLGDQSKKKKG